MYFNIFILINEMMIQAANACKIDSIMNACTIDRHDESFVKKGKTNTNRLTILRKGISNAC